MVEIDSSGMSVTSIDFDCADQHILRLEAIAQSGFNINKIPKQTYCKTKHFKMVY